MNDNTQLDKQQILAQAHALSNNRDLFCSQLILTLSAPLTLEQFKLICDSVLYQTSTRRDLFCSQLILALSATLSLEQFNTVCDSMLDQTSSARSLFED